MGVLRTITIDLHGVDMPRRQSTLFDVAKTVFGFHRIYDDRPDVTANRQVTTLGRFEGALDTPPTEDGDSCDTIANLVSLDQLAASAMILRAMTSRWISLVPS